MNISLVAPVQPWDVPGMVAASAGSVFSELTALARTICVAPSAALSLLGEDREWCMAVSSGSLMAGDSGVSSFCRSALNSQQVFEVAHTISDSRFASAPGVDGEPWLRFFAGAPVILDDGLVVGVLSVMDVVPRGLTADQRRDLAVLARQMASQLELRRRIDVLLHTQAAMRSDRRVLAGVVEHTDVLIYAKDLGGRYLLANPAMQARLVVPEGLLGRGDHDLFPAEMADIFRRNDQLVVAELVRQEFEENLTHPDGSLHMYRSTKFPLLDEQQQVYGIAGVSTDVTELITARSELAESEQRWRALVEHSPVAVAVIGADGRFSYANPQAVALCGGYVAEDIEGQLALAFVSAKDYREINALFGEVRAGGSAPCVRRWQLRQLGGQHRTVEINAAAVLHRGTRSVQVELRDVSVQAAAEEALRDSERRFHAVFNDSPVAMALSDETGRWVETNAAFGVLVGVAPADLIGGTAKQYAHPEDHRLIDGSGQGQQDSPDRVHNLEVRFIRPDGTVRWAWVSITATPGPAGEPWTLAIVQDITIRKAAEEALRESDADLAAIATVTRAVRAGLDPRPVVVQAVRHRAGASTVALLEPLDLQSLRVTASAGIEAAEVPVSLQADSMTAEVWRTGKAVFLADAAHHPVVDPARSALAGTISMLWQPVTVQNEVRALLKVTWQHRIADLGDRAVQAVQMIADEAGMSMHAEQMRQELQLSALTDPLTGLLNRRAWDEQIIELLAEVGRTGEPLTVALMDLDYFKSYNDTNGHSAGDVLLRDFAAAARDALRHTDIFARWGGEEFIVAIPHASAAQVAVILNRVRACLPPGCTCSIGHTRWAPGEPIGTTIARADAALYDAKRNGRDKLAGR